MPKQCVNYIYLPWYRRHKSRTLENIARWEHTENKLKTKEETMVETSMTK